MPEAADKVDAYLKCISEVALGNPEFAVARRQLESSVKALAMPEVDYLVVCAGRFDILAEVVAEDDDHLMEVVHTRIRSIPEVRSAELFVYLKLRKQIYTWGTR